MANVFENTVEDTTPDEDLVQPNELPEKVEQEPEPEPKPDPEPQSQPEQQPEPEPEPEPGICFEKIMVIRYNLVKLQQSCMQCMHVAMYVFISAVLRVSHCVLSLQQKSTG